MITNPFLIPAFAVSFALFILVPPFLDRPFPGYPSMHWADIMDLATPLVLMPMYWLLFTDAGRRRRARGTTVAFVVLGALWTMGHGMHLSANSIGNLLVASTSPIAGLVHFYDEVLSHYLWHAAMLGFSFLLVTGPGEEIEGVARGRRAAIVSAAVLYGFTFFAAVIEGGTVPMSLPTAVSFIIWILTSRRLRSGHLAWFFLCAYVVAVVLTVGWWGYWGRFMEFSEMGLL